MSSSAQNHGGDQRLPLQRLQAFEALGFGMFIHFGIPTFAPKAGHDFVPAAAFAPTDLDVEQWVTTARDAGMRYLVLVAKHHAGFCLWPTKHTDYSITASPCRRDIVGEFVTACRKHGVQPGLYYCSDDNYHLFDTPNSHEFWKMGQGTAYRSRAYMEFQTAQITELMQTYGPLLSMWIDIPIVLGRSYRRELYEHIARLDPNILVVMNNGQNNGRQLLVDKIWPSDVITIERDLPPSMSGHVKWREVEGRRVYVPGEICETLGRQWFHEDDDLPRRDGELLAMAALARIRGVNLLLNVPPDTTGRIAPRNVAALMRLWRNLEEYLARFPIGGSDAADTDVIKNYEVHS